MDEEQSKRLKHDLKKPFSNLEMLIIILKGADMDKSRIIYSLEKILNEGNEALKALE